MSILEDTSQDEEMQDRLHLRGIYLVSTPIGNLKDFSQRGVEVLQKVDLIACEDTRVTRKLLNRYRINTGLSSYHKFTSKKKKEFLMEKAVEGSLAVVADAGTPIIADPGHEMIKKAKAEGIPVTSVPGPCAVINGLVLSGADPKSFFYGGWEYKFSPHTCVFFISPHKISNSLEKLEKIFGGNRHCSLAREMTKIHEEVITDTIPNLRVRLRGRKIRGEITAVMHSQKTRKEEDPAWKEWMNEALRYLPPGQAAQLISKIGSVPRRTAYEYATNRGNEN